MRYFLLVFFIALVVLFLILNLNSPSFHNKTKETLALTGISDCDLLKSKCKFKVDNKKIALSFSGIVKTMKSFRLNADVFNFENKIEEISVVFYMTSMSMGINKFILKKHEAVDLTKSHWEASVLLPICVSKRSDWKMEFSVETADKIYKVVIPLNIE